MMKTAWLLLVPLLFAPQSDTLKIAPSNGFMGAVSFTFDEGSLVLRPH